jgi:hypothetical protein
VRTLLFVSIAVLIASSAAAAPPVERVAVPIPGATWRIAFELPPLLKHQQSSTDAGFAYLANARQFNVSFYVETPSGSGQANEDVYKFYWSKAARSPLIKSSTIRAAVLPRFVRVTYEIEAPFEGRTVHQKNANYYFAFRGTWVDVHVSVIEPEEGDDAVLQNFEKTLTCEPLDQ